MTVQTWQPGMFERPCGGCTMCCKAPGIPEINKPPNVWCRNCDRGRACRIYDARPQACRDFYCLWKVMPDFPEELRPDRCKVIWTLTDDGAVAVATTEYSKALNANAQEMLIRQFLRSGISVVPSDGLGQRAEARLARGARRDEVARSLAEPRRQGQHRA